jgi:BASS family bile acid:Na+ symporter
MTHSLLVILKILVAVLIAAVGLGSTAADLAYLWRRPRLLLRSLLAMYLLVPLLALGLVAVLPLSPGSEIALLVLAISAGAPLVPRKLMPLDNDAYIFSLVVTSSLLAIVTVPAWAALLAPLYGRTSYLTPGHIAPVVATSFLAPLALGMVLRLPLRAVAERLSEMILKLGGAVLALCGLVLLVANGELLLEAGWPFLATLAVMTCGALAIGHLTGGPDPEDRTALAVCCATRHVGIAVLVAASVPGPRTAVLVAANIVVSAVVSIPYLRWRRRAALTDGEPATRDG